MTASSGAAFAIIPARGGSKGIPGKNLRPVGGTPLVARSVAAALGAGLAGVAVSTDDPAIAAVARDAGAETIARPAEIAGDTASSESALLHALDHLAADGRAPDILVMLQCTSPFTTAADIRAVVAAVAEGGFDCAFSASSDHGFLWRIGSDGAAEGVNHDHRRQRQRRQDLAPQFRENGAIYAMRAAGFRREGRRFFGRIGLVETATPPIEIDAPADLAVVDAFAAARG